LLASGQAHQQFHTAGGVQPASDNRAGVVEDNETLVTVGVSTVFGVRARVLALKAVGSQASGQVVKRIGRYTGTLRRVCRGRHNLNASIPGKCIE
jgi:hypothetical protein